jgi:hypothetical protein
MEARLFLPALLALLLLGGPALAGGEAPVVQQDTISPQVLDIEPHGENVSVEDTEIVIFFSEPMDTRVADVARVLQGGSIVPATVSWDAAGRNLTMHLTVGELEHETNYTVRVVADARDLEGNRLDGDGDGTQEGDADVHEETFRTDPVPVVPRQPAPLNPWIVFAMVVVALLALYGVTRLQRP